MSSASFGGFRKILAALLIAVVFLYIGFILGTGRVVPVAGRAVGGVLANDIFLEGLENSAIDLSDSKVVFRYVFKSLPDVVTVYPTENYFYWRFPAQGKLIWGSISLSAQTRDQGELGFGYSEHSEDPGQVEPFNRAGGGDTYSAEDGVVVEKIDSFSYRVTFEGKSVVFRLNDIGMAPPMNAKLLPGEIFVGPVHDESGIRFHLMFSNRTSSLFMLLNDDSYVPEHFDNYTDSIMVGQRTGFAFYDDTNNSRRILIGVRGENTLKNNWYDGPHDQMPDNYIAAGLIPNYQKYLEAAYPGTAGRIDKYGNYLENNGTRIAVAPYSVYFSKEELLFTNVCEAENANHDPSEFYACVTKQEYNVPEKFERQLFPVPAPVAQ